MTDSLSHPVGEAKRAGLVPAVGPVAVDSFGGDPCRVGCASGGDPLGQLPFFIEFRQVSGQFDPWVESSPLVFTSPNAPSKRDVRGTAMLSILSGHRRYAHISALRGDHLNAALLGMEGVVRGGGGEVAAGSPRCLCGAPAGPTVRCASALTATGAARPTWPGPSSKGWGICSRCD